MSGRLILAAGKSYTPWRSDNIDRVARDEAEEADRLAGEAAAARAETSRIMMIKLRAKR